MSIATIAELPTPPQPLVKEYRKYEFPDVVNRLNTKPTKEALNELSKRYPDWSRLQLERLWHFRMYHKKPESAYTYAHCSCCQPNIYLEYNQKGENGWYLIPKVRIPFKQFVDACFAPNYFECLECRNKTKTSTDVSRLRAIGIPAEFFEASFKTWNITLPFQEKLFETGKQVVKDYTRLTGMFLSGATGTGKSRMAVTVINEVRRIYEDNMTIKFIDFPTLAAKGRLKEADQQDFIRLDLLCIDDLTKDAIGMEFAQYVYPIIAKRYSEQRFTIITTNMNLKKDWLGSSNTYLQRLGDRFKDFVCRETFGEKSLRGKK